MLRRSVGMLLEDFLQEIEQCYSSPPPSEASDVYMQGSSYNMAESGCSKKIYQEPLQSGTTTDVWVVDEHQLGHVEQDFESPARKRRRIERHPDGSPIGFPYQLVEAVDGAVTGHQNYGSEHAWFQQQFDPEFLYPLLNYKPEDLEAFALREQKISAYEDRMNLQFVNSLLNEEGPGALVEQMSSEETNRPIKETEDAGSSSTRLCDLPDDLLAHVLSFLPSKDAARTSWVSKRWCRLWALVPHVNLAEDYFPKRPIFLDFLRRATELRSGSAVRSLSLSCTVKGAGVRIKRSIGLFLSCGLRDLALFLSNNTKGKYVLPPSIFECQTLRKLEVRARCSLGKLLSSVCNSKLEVLILEEVRFDDVGSVEKLFSCPSLKELTIRKCNWRKLKGISISATNLRHLTIDNYGRKTGSSDGVEVRINGSRLESFHYSSVNVEEQFVISNAAGLAKADLHIGLSQVGPVVRNRIHKLLLAVSKAKELNLCRNSIQNKVLVENEKVPRFNNAIKLTVEKVFYWNVKGLWTLLMGYPRLQSLCFEKEFNYFPVGGADGLLDQKVPPCFLTELKQIYVKVSSLQQEQLFMIGVLLEKAVALEEMIVRFPEKSLDGKVLLDQLTKLMEGSRNCRISLQPLPT